MIKNYLILLVFFIGASNFLLAQTVTGTVLDESSQPLPGVTIVVKGTAVGSVSDFDGNYSVSASNGDVLIFSFIPSLKIFSFSVGISAPAA